MLDFTWPILGAIVAGGLIGFEREWRGRPAGFRTHILVSLASMLLMYASVTQGDWRFTGWRTACSPASASSAQA